LSGILDELVGSDRHSHQDHASTSHHHH
jgi:hypothetical protein